VKRLLEQDLILSIGNLDGWMLWCPHIMREEKQFFIYL